MTSFFKETELFFWSFHTTEWDKRLLNRRALMSRFWKIPRKKSLLIKTRRLSNRLSNSVVKLQKFSPIKKKTRQWKFVRYRVDEFYAETYRFRKNKTDMKHPENIVTFFQNKKALIYRQKQAKIYQIYFRKILRCFYASEWSHLQKRPATQRHWNLQ